MKIVEQSIALEHDFDGADAMRRIERAGRTCYKSEDRITDDSAVDFVRMIVRRGHESVLEHVALSVRVVCDRGVSHELVRHRIASFSQESTRYCNYGKDRHGGEIAVIQPPGLKPEALRLWRRACEEAEMAYLAMLADGVAPQIARAVLPTCLKTEMVMTANLREWRHILRLRTSPAAHPQMRELARALLEQLRVALPAVFEDVAT